MSDQGHTEQALRPLVEGLRVPALLTRDGLILCANEALVAVSGHPREALEGHSYTLLVTPEQRRLVAEHAELMRRTGEVVRTQFASTMATASGKELPVQVAVSAYPANDGGAPFALTLLFVSTEDRRAHQLSEALVQVSTTFVGELTEERIRRAVVLGLERRGLWSGFFRAEAGQLLPLESAPGEPPAPLRSVFAYEAVYERRPVFAGTDEVTHAFVPIATDGIELVLVVFGRFNTGHASSLALFAKQIAGALDNAGLIDRLERRNLQAQMLLELARTLAGTLERAEILPVACDYLARLTDASNCFIMLVDEQARVLRGAAASSRVRSQWTAATIPLDHPESLAARAVRERRVLAVEDVEATGSQYFREFVQKYGQRALMALPLMLRDEILGVAVLDDTRAPRRFSAEAVELARVTLGQIALSVANARLYESLKESYAVLAQARAEMVKQERLAALGELSAIVAHEVRNPLGVIFNAVSSLRRMANDDSLLLLDILAEESDRLNRLVSELLDFARPRELVMSPEDVARLIQESLEAATNDPQRGASPVVFTAEVEPGLPPVPMDRRQVRQALVNVAVNASQAMPRGGTVRVHAARELRGGRNVLRIDLRDEGPGITPEVAARIFEPFFTTKAKGTGLGLAVVKRILEDHDGEVEVTSDVGQGTTFTFRLPMDVGGIAR